MSETSQWLDHSGVAMPVSYYAIVDAKFRNGRSVHSVTAGKLEWVAEADPYDIIAYRVVEEPRP